MSSIKYINEMFSDLLKSIQDGEVASKIADIQALVLSLQAEEYKTKEKNLDLRDEISLLKEQLFQSIKIMSKLKTENETLKAENQKFPSKPKERQKELFQPAGKPEDTFLTKIK